jgi:hypothetical protein
MKKIAALLALSLFATSAISGTFVRSYSSSRSSYQRSYQPGAVYHSQTVVVSHQQQGHSTGSLLAAGAAGMFAGHVLSGGNNNHPVYVNNGGYAQQPQYQQPEIIQHQPNESPFHLENGYSKNDYHNTSFPWGLFFFIVLVGGGCYFAFRNKPA